eukprot:m.127435 g.127435  ORF g.127435 m.127435 type:complete len:56 (+) comp23544_c3_seq4:65-232(+)
MVDVASLAQTVYNTPIYWRLFTSISMFTGSVILIRVWPEAFQADIDPPPLPGVAP